MDNGRGTFQQCDEPAEPILCIAYGFAYDALVAKCATLNVVSYAKTHKAAVGLQLFRIERSLD